MLFFESLKGLSKILKIKILFFNFEIYLFLYVYTKINTNVWTAIFSSVHLLKKI